MSEVNNAADGLWATKGIQPMQRRHDAGTIFVSRNAHHGKADLNVFFMRLQEQDDWVTTWSDKTIAAILFDEGEDCEF